MSYELQALIGTVELLTVAAAEVPAARVVPLAQGLALIPATPAFLSALRLDGAERKSDGEAAFAWHPAGFELRLAAWSKAGPIACVEAEFFGGTGAQCAAVWSDGRLDLGPLTSAFEPFPPEGSPISRALRRIGVRTEAGCPDEFETVGLHAHRSTDAWAAAG
ncbi:hypothetical protein KV557_04395 [Kitasatospora aureofaciens]|uniref:hypothetical protein n=1 Tax=Kitasatospora aureofaciens TaxID=1894 RepID=UPI001C44944F|nr:hypothetical protein [Kitasatospora aureofaciens]MBV6696367.1 hypothetical protein [Kitasatospora aureofaciens]